MYVHCVTGLCSVCVCVSTALLVSMVCVYVCPLCYWSLCRVQASLEGPAKDDQKFEELQGKVSHCISCDMHVTCM